MLINQQHEFIYNCDETSLFWRQVPDKTYFISKTEHVGDKLFHERISILFCVNRKGEKLSPLAIGKAVKPRCFYKDCLISLDLNYVSQTNAWMDRDTFNFWLSSWHKTLANQDKKVILLLDNFQGHVVDYTNFPMITFKFLPPATTCLTQPLDG